MSGGAATILIPLESEPYNLSASTSSVTQADGGCSFNKQLNEFLSLFPMRHDSEIRRGTGSWHRISQFHLLSDDDILRSLDQHSLLHRACRFDTTTHFAALHIPAASAYHNAAGLSYIKQALGEIGPFLKCFQYADDWYLYVFFQTPIQSSDIYAAFYRILATAKVDLCPSNIRIHPTDAAMPLPLQSGFAWLNNEGMVFVQRDEISLESAISLFLFDRKKNSIDPNLLFRASAECDFARCRACASDSQIPSFTLTRQQILSESRDEESIDAACSTLASDHEYHPRDSHDLVTRRFTARNDVSTDRSDQDVKSLLGKLLPVQTQQVDSENTPRGRPINTLEKSRDPPRSLYEIAYIEFWRMVAA